MEGLGFCEPCFFVRLVAMSPLSLWMRLLLRFAGTFNVLAGASMVCLYHEGFKLLHIRQPELALPVQMMGILVALFGVGYHMVANRPVENRSILVSGVVGARPWARRLRWGTSVWASCRFGLPWWCSWPTWSICRRFG